MNLSKSDLENKKEDVKFCRPASFEFHEFRNPPKDYAGCTILVTENGDSIFIYNTCIENSVAVQRNGIHIGTFSSNYSLSAFLNALKVFPK